MKSINKIIGVVMLAVLAFACTEEYDCQLPTSAKPGDVAQSEYLNSFDLLKNYTAGQFSLGAYLSASDFLAKELPYSILCTNFQVLEVGNDFTPVSLTNDNGEPDFFALTQLVEETGSMGLTLYGGTLLANTSQRTAYLNTLIAPDTIWGDKQGFSLVVNDFEADELGATYPMTGNSAATVVDDPKGISGKCLQVGNAETPANQSFPIFSVMLPAGITLGVCKSLILDFNGTSSTGLYGSGMRLGINSNANKSYGTPTSFGCPGGDWGRGKITLEFATLELTDTEKALTSFTIKVGSATGAGNYYIDNIKIYYETGEDDQIVPKTEQQKKALLTAELAQWISGNVGTGIKAWNIVGEPLNASGASDANTFVWKDYLGDPDYARTAVKIARDSAASPLDLFVSSAIEIDESSVQKAELTGGNATGVNQNLRVKITYGANSTAESRSQTIRVTNKTTGIVSELVIEQETLSDKSTSKAYYVSTTGSDNNDGSKSNPFKTIAKAASVVKAGETVLVKGGTYTEHSIKPSESGTNTAMIVFKPASANEQVIIKHPGTSVDDLTAIFDLSSGNYIWIEGFKFYDFKYGKACVYMNNAKGNVIINNQFEKLRVNEITAWNATSAIFIYKSSENIIRNNLFKDIYGDAIGVNENSGMNLICENTFYDLHGMKRSWAGENGSAYSSGITCQETSQDKTPAMGNNVFAFNYGEKLSNLVWFDRNGSDNIVLRNVGYDSKAFIFNESRCKRNVIQENIAYKITGVAFESAHYDGTQDTEDARYINNVSYNCKTGYYVSKSWRNEFRNNITFNSTDYNIDFTSVAAQADHGPHVFKNNLWFTQSKSKSMRYAGTAKTVAEFAQSVGGINELSVAPQFANPAGGDFTLLSGSPAKGAGDTATDLGAYAVYGKIPVGYDETMEINENLLQVSFSTILSTVRKGETLYVTLELNKLADQAVSVELAPVAGDSRDGVDFNFSRTVSFNVGENKKTVAISFA